MAVKKRTTRKSSKAVKPKARKVTSSKKAVKTKAKVKAKATTKTKAKAVKAVKAAAVKPKALGKVSAPFTKTQLFTTLAEQTGLTKVQVSAVFDQFNKVVEGHLKGSGPQKFTFPGLLKMTVKKVPARKARKGVNPFTGEPTIFKAKPASKKVKITALKAVKDMV